MNTPSSTTRITYSEIFNASWGAMKDQLVLVAGLTLVWMLGVGALSFLPAVGWMLTGPFTAGYIRSLLKLRAKDTIDFGDIFWGFTELNRLIHFVLVSFLATLVVVIGFICLFIPGIYLCLATMLATQVMVLHGTDSVESIKRSIHLVKGRWWWFAGLAMIVGILNLMGALCFIVGIFVTIPLSQFIFIQVVETLSKEKGYSLGAPGAPSEPLSTSQGNLTSVFPVNPS